ncbi:MAG: hypothetical protein E6R13_05960 [Spirochaetes bacterium]|nr:MAG: hypothetical protein E6R13_05960 [Spirochaetota bacterium]
MDLSDETIKEVFALSLSSNTLSLEDYSFKTMVNPNYKIILVEKFNRKIPSDFYRMQILNNNDIILEMAIDGEWHEQAIYNQAKVQEMLKNQ